MSAPGIVVLTGAGISRESGLATFRDADGLWAEVDVEDVATPWAYARDPARVQAFYDMRRLQLQDPAIQPNAAHHALARLAREHPGPVLVVTQNVDDLHDRAGQPGLLHMHGELLKARCLRCEVVSRFEGAGLAAALSRLRRHSPSPPRRLVRRDAAAHGRAPNGAQDAVRPVRRDRHERAGPSRRRLRRDGSRSGHGRWS